MKENSKTEEREKVNKGEREVKRRIEGRERCGGRMSSSYNKMKERESKRGRPREEVVIQ